MIYLSTDLKRSAHNMSGDNQTIFYKKTVANPFIYNNQYWGCWEETEVQKEAGAPTEYLIVEEVEVVNQGTLPETPTAK